MWDGISSFIPKRSQPQTPLELPTENGWYWMWSESDGKWKLKSCTPVAHWGKGRYVRAVPPIVAKAVDEDAEWLRGMADAFETWTEVEILMDRRLKTAQLRRIADRLEKENG
jgi:hypothetical protein